MSSLVYLRTYLGQPTSIDVSGQIHRTTIDGRPAFTVAGGLGKGVTVTFTILRTITPAAASTRGLFTVQTNGAQITQRELSPGTHPSIVPAYWFGSSVDGLSLREYNQGEHRNPHGVLPVPGLRRTRAQVVLRLMAGRRLPGERAVRARARRAAKPASRARRASLPYRSAVDGWAAVTGRTSRTRSRA